MYFSNMTAEKFEATAPDTLRWGYVIPHDIIWVPLGCLMVEKAVGSAHSITVRASSAVFMRDQVEIAEILRQSYPQKLVWS